MPNVNYLGPASKWIGNDFSKYDNISIGVINWWWLSPEEATIENIVKFVDSNDICFFYSEEILYRHSHIDLNELFLILNSKNVFYIMMAEDYNLRIPPEISRSFYVPWFFKSRLFIENNFKLDLDYRDKQYAFNMMLGSIKPNRTLIYKLLSSNKNIYSTYFGHDKYKLESLTEYENEEIVNLLNGQDVSDNKRLDTMVTTPSGHTLSHVVPTKIYENSHFDIVAETFIKENHHFLTEKTAKPLATGRFFCWYSSSNLTGYLKKYGFSFETYFCSYDKITDHICRLDSFVNDVENISNSNSLIKHIYQVTKEERIHNMNVYKSVTERLPSEIESWLEMVIENV